jgi:ABC-type transporter lipoprotein component MlaA
LLGDQCLSEDVVELPEEEPEEFMTPEAYIESINKFINNANITTVVNNVLIEQAKEALQNIPGLPEP